MATEASTHAFGYYQLIPATHVVGRCSRRLRRGGRGRPSDNSLARCGRSRLGLAATRDQHQGDSGKRRTKYDCSFHKHELFLQKTIRRRSRRQTYLGLRILLFGERTKFSPDRFNQVRPSPAVSLTRHVFVLIREFSS